jgi:hypothetical protein
MFEAARVDALEQASSVALTGSLLLEQPEAKRRTNATDEGPRPPGKRFMSGLSGAWIS